MNPIFKKLNYKSQQQLYIINVPASFEKDMSEMVHLASIKTNLTGAKQLEFFLAFVTKQAEVDNLTKKVIPLVAGDGLVWFAYPKGTSKKYTCEFNRDTGWAMLGKHGYEGVRAVAIDEDWTAIRFRKAEHIKTITRSFAMSETGKRKVTDDKKSVKRKRKN
jgi:hypothetical protein